MHSMLVNTAEFNTQLIAEFSTQLATELGQEWHMHGFKNLISWFIFLKEKVMFSQVITMTTSVLCNGIKVIFI
jgi:hypothetical protein